MTLIIYLNIAYYFLLYYTTDVCLLTYLKFYIVKYSLIFQLAYAKRPRHVIRGYIYYAKLGKNIGSEQNDFRPVLVIQAGKGNPKRLLGTHVEITHPSLTKKIYHQKRTYT